MIKADNMWCLCISVCQVWVWCSSVHRMGGIVSGYMWKCSHVLFLWKRVVPSKVGLFHCQDTYPECKLIKKNYFRFTKQLTRPPTYMSARTRRTQMMPGSYRPATVIVPSTYQSQGGRRYEKSEGRRGTHTQAGSQYSRAIKSPQPPIDSTVWCHVPKKNIRQKKPN